MPNSTIKRWTADDIAKLKNLAQKQNRAEAHKSRNCVGRATTVKAHHFGVR